MATAEIIRFPICAASEEADDAFARGGWEDDPILALIAEQDRLRTLGIKARELAEARDWDSAGDDPAVIATEGRADELFDRIIDTRATTMRGAIAKFELLIIDPTQHVESVLADLRGLA